MTQTATMAAHSPGSLHFSSPQPVEAMFGPLSPPWIESVPPWDSAPAAPPWEDATTLPPWEEVLPALPSATAGPAIEVSVPSRSPRGNGPRKHLTPPDDRAVKPLVPPGERPSPQGQPSPEPPPPSQEPPARPQGHGMPDPCATFDDFRRGPCYDILKRLTR
ncbi:hypothetical protein [Nonomuraea insulae]|uniref:Uncharacterized protein n=1 Tax=Nonomuraea insulae TaxID=1616787 RepID=A0ABW1CIB6_9ACTN